MGGHSGATRTALIDTVLRQDGSVEDGFAAMADYMRPIAIERRGGDGTDVITRLVNGKIDGKQVDFDIALRLCQNILLGGLDTVVDFLSFTFHFLARNPAHRRELRDNPDLVPNAIMELGRRFGVVFTAREIREDMIFDGVQLKGGIVGGITALPLRWDAASTVRVD